MKNRIENSFGYIFTLVFLVFVYSCNDSKTINNNQLPEPQIKAGTANVSGKVLYPEPETLSLTLRFPNPVTAEESMYETLPGKDGSFQFEVPIECSLVFGYIVVSGHGGSMVELSPDKETKIEIRFDETGKTKINSVERKNLLSSEDIDNIVEVIGRYLTYRYAPEPLYDKTPQMYAQYEMEMLKARMDYAMKGATLSDEAREFILNEINLLHLKGRLLPYKEAMELSYMNSNEIDSLGNFKPENIDKTYYFFLKSFNLNNPKYFYSTYYSITMQRILSAKGLNIPPISDIPVEEWLKEVKATLTNLTGFNSGLFYDMLATNSYAKQFNEEMAPLTNKQKENILAYFGEGEIANILLRKNEEITRLAENKSKPVVHETPAVPLNKLMDTIVSGYKGKVVIVDFWATWCQPCMEAMKKMNTVKNDLKDKKIVYVYITNGSSPKELWNKQINLIGGDQYYVNGEEWEYLMKNLEFNSIPSYIIYDTQGNLKHKFTAYPGSEKIKNIITQLL